MSHPVAGREHALGGGALLAWRPRELHLRADSHVRTLGPPALGLPELSAAGSGRARTTPGSGLSIVPDFRGVQTCAWMVACVDRLRLAHPDTHPRVLLDGRLPQHWITIDAGPSDPRWTFHTSQWTDRHCLSFLGFGATAGQLAPTASGSCTEEDRHPRSVRCRWPPSAPHRSLISISVAPDVARHADGTTLPSM